MIITMMTYPFRQITSRLSPFGDSARPFQNDVGERWIEGDGDRLQAWGFLGP